MGEGFVALGSIIGIALIVLVFIAVWLLIRKE